MAGDEVTAEGRRLAALYTELDLLAAECLRRGTWAGLSAPELAEHYAAASYTTSAGHAFHGGTPPPFWGPRRTPRRVQRW